MSDGFQSISFDDYVEKVKVNILKNLLTGILLTLTIPVWAMIEEDYLTIPCDPYWWKENSLYQVEQLAEDLGQDQMIDALCEEGTSFFDLAAMTSPDPEVIIYLFVDIGFHIDQDVLSFAAMNENPEILNTLNTLDNSNTTSGDGGYSEDNLDKSSAVTEEDQQGGIRINPEDKIQPAQPQQNIEWYAGVAVSSSLPFKINQEGWNHDTTCYPTDNCGVSPITGYRWFYDLESQRNPKKNSKLAEAFVGFRYKQAVRFELAVGHQYSQLEQRIKDVKRYTDPGLVEPIERSLSTNAISSNAVSSNALSEVEGLTTNTFMVNTYYDFFQWSSATLYGGVGIGAAQTTINGVHYSTDYEDIAEPLKDYYPPLSSYNSQQDTDMSDWLPLLQLHIGTDLHSSEKAKFGAKLTFSKLLGPLRYQGFYSVHPMHSIDPNFPNYNMFENIQYLTAMMTFKWQ